MKRGQVYFIQIPFSTGREMRKTRPGVIVSGGDEEELDKRGLLQVVLCSGSSDHAIETHVPLRGLAKPSVAMCEHLYTVDRSRIGVFAGRCTAGEIAAIDNALALVLGLRTKGQAAPHRIEAGGADNETNRDPSY